MSPVDLLYAPLQQVLHFGDGATDRIVETAGGLFRADMESGEVGQTDGGGDFPYDGDLFADRIGCRKLCFGEEYGQRDGGETSSASDVEDAGAGVEPASTGDGERMEYVFQVERSDVFSGDYVDACVPGFVEGTERSELFPLMKGEFRKIA